METTLKINVEGTTFEVTVLTLMNIPYFNNLFTDTKIDQNTVFIDRSAKAFAHVLRYARDDTDLLPKKYLPDYDFFY
jgi:hypothetical protein